MEFSAADLSFILGRASRYAKFPRGLAHWVPGSGDAVLLEQGEHTVPSLLRTIIGIEAVGSTSVAEHSTQNLH